MTHDALVDLVAQSAFRVRLVRATGASGDDIDEDGVADVPLDRVRSRG